MSELDELFTFLKEVEETPGLVEDTIVFNRVKKHIGAFSTKEFAWILSKVIIRNDLQSMMMKARADSGDTLAAEKLDLQINGDPLSKQESKQMGLMGLWSLESNEVAGELLVNLGVITQEDYNKKINPQMSLDSGTIDEQLAKAASEAKTFASYSDYLMAVYSDTLEEVDRPTLTNLTKLMSGKYPSVEDFYYAAIKGKLDIKTETPAEPVKPKEPPAEPVNAIQSVDDVKKEIEDKIAAKTSQASLFEFSDKKKAYIT